MLFNGPLEFVPPRKKCPCSVAWGGNSKVFYGIIKIPTFFFKNLVRGGLEYVIYDITVKDFGVPPPTLQSKDIFFEGGELQRTIKKNKK